MTNKGEPIIDCDSVTVLQTDVGQMLFNVKMGDISEQGMWIDGFEMLFSDDNFQQKTISQETKGCPWGIRIVKMIRPEKKLMFSSI